MSATTKINWTDSTWNPVTGCTPAGVGCAHCYAKRVAERFPAVHGVEFSSESLTSTATCPVPFSTVICHPERLTIPERWRKPRAIMCPSMGDLFHEDVPETFIAKVFQVINDCRHHTFIVLTKRPDKMDAFLKGCKQDGLGFITHNGNVCSAYGGDGMILAADNRWPLPNVILGVSCSTQAEADHAIPILLDTPADRRIVSLEPLVGPVDLREVGGVGYKRASDGVNRPLLRYDALRGREQCGPAIYEHGNKLDGVIVGGETGPGARPMHPDWVRSLRDQCAVAGVPFFFKQWGEWAQSDYPSYTMFDATQAGRLVEATCVSSTDKASRGSTRFYPIPADYDGKPAAFHPMVRVGRSRAGRLLDGREHNELCWEVGR